MTLLALILAVIALGALAHWRFGDPDRSDRIVALIGPEKPLAFLLVSVCGVVDHTLKRSWIAAACFAVNAAVWVGVYLKERGERRRGSSQRTS